MKVTIEQVQTGLALYVDNELAPHFDGWKEWVYPTVAALYIDNLANVIDILPISAIGLKAEDGRIDIDKVYREMKKRAEKSSMTITVPKLNDTFTFGGKDLDKLYDYITKGNARVENYLMTPK